MAHNTLGHATYLDALNDAQRQAVMHDKGPAMVLAGAGSGKTRVLTARVAWLMSQHHVAPDQIQLVTFTNKAATEMIDRVIHLTGQRLPFAGTFHRICARILRRDGHHIGLTSTFVIFDADDQQQLIKSLLKQLGYDHKEYKPAAILGMISNAKNEMLSSEKYKELAQGKYQSAAAKVYGLYQFELKKNNAVDFDDLLLKTLELFQKHPQVLDRYQQQFEHVLIDEYQDTNAAQYQLTKLLASPQHNLFVVGDAAQAIYSWRGADYRNLLQIRTDFPDVKEYRLEQNYRSTPRILDAASHVIQQNTSHPILSLWTEHSGENPRISVYSAHDNQQEAQTIADTISRQFSDGDYDKIAILYRTNAQSRSFEEAFLRLSIPYRIVGGVKFYARKEIKDLLSYLRLVLNPNDSVSIERVSKIGKRRYAQFDRWRTTLAQIAVELHPLEMLDQIIAATAYKDFFDAQDPEDIARLENIEELRAVAHQFEQLDQFLENVALVDSSASSGRDMADTAPTTPDQTAVTMMSIHSAKGLEFDTVFLVGLEEGLFPHSRALMDRLQMEEERRLCYVAITRAKRKLYLSFARQRFFYGSLTTATMSRFIAEIPEELLDIIELEPPHFQSTQYPHSSFRPYTRAQQPTPSKQRTIVIDDSEFDDILSGEIDVDTWLNS